MLSSQTPSTIIPDTISPQDKNVGEGVPQSVDYKVHSRRKSSNLEKAESRVNIVYLDTKTEKMVKNSTRRRIWIRALILGVFGLGLTWFFIAEESVRVPEYSDFRDETSLNAIPGIWDSSYEFSESINNDDGKLLSDEKYFVTSPNLDLAPSLTSIHCTIPHPGRQLIQYALMIDAGSTGSRIHVYRFNYCKSSPELEDEIFAHTEPGLSKYPDPESAAKSLNTLLDVALERVPVELQNCTPIAVKATAGLRLLGQDKSQDILRAIREHLELNYPFPIIEKEGVAIMDGRDEGVYAWITVNYLLERIGSTKKQPTAAIFDLGGGSTQIVFEPDTVDGFDVAPGDHRYELEYGEHKYVLYQHSYLGYGLMEARKAIKNFMTKIWYKETKKINSKIAIGTDNIELPIEGNQVPHPCLPKNYTEVWPLDPSFSSDIIGTTTLVGTGAGHAQCRAITEQVLNKEKECTLSPCSFNGVYQPPLHQTFSFHDIYAFSYFYDRASPLGMPSEFSLRELRDLADKVCASNLNNFAHLPDAIKELNKNPHYCMDLTFIYELLHIGYEIPLERELKIAKKIKGIETGWCLGAAIAILDQKLWCK
ncbi:hypothetical protein G9A89_005280 [Geosiphon pyriformis]|nr:hypothetical protein G9A89_005280 [Geosiphon pyriformis]